MATATLDDRTVELDLDEARAALVEASSSIRDSGTTDETLLQASDPVVTVAFVDTLRTNGIDTLRVDPADLSTDAGTLGAVFRGGQTELAERGLPDPDVALYQDARAVSEATGQSYFEAVSDLRGAQPLTMRGELSGREDVAGMDAPEVARAVPEVEGPVGEVAEYDVHFMAYPLAYKEIAGVPVIDSQPSHAFVVVTQKGGNPLDRDDVLIAARAGPDNATETVYLPDSSLPDGEQSETEKTDNGNVYASDQGFAIDNDVEHPGAFQVEKTTVTGNITDMRALVEGHRRFINGEDIDYELLNRNSNTYAGDVYEMLTGEEPPTSEWERMNIRYFPAVNNDLVDYEKTPYADRFDDNEPGFVAEEDASYGLD